MPNKGKNRGALDRIVYTDGSNGIVRLPPHLWRAFYEAAQYCEYPSVQDCFIDYLTRGFAVTLDLDWSMVATRLQ